MLNPDEEGHAPPPAPLLGAFLDAPRRELRARDGLDPDVFGMAKLPPELQRCIKQLAGLKSLAHKQECKPTCVRRAVHDEDLVRLHDHAGRVFEEWKVEWGKSWRRIEGWQWERIDEPLLAFDEEVDWMQLPSFKKAGGKGAAAAAKRGQCRPRNESIGLGAIGWRWVPIGLDFCLGAMDPRSMVPSWPTAPYHQPASRCSNSARDERFKVPVPNRVLAKQDRPSRYEELDRIWEKLQIRAHRIWEKRRRYYERVRKPRRQQACLAACLAIQRKAERAHLAAVRRAAKAVRHKVNCAILRGSRSGGGGYGNLYEILTLA